MKQPLFTGDACDCRAAVWRDEVPVVENIRYAFESGAISFREAVRMLKVAVRPCRMPPDCATLRDDASCAAGPLTSEGAEDKNV